MVPPPAAVHGLLRWPTPVLPAIHRSFSPPQPCLRRHLPLPSAWPCPWRRRPLWSSRGLVRGGCRCHARFADFPGIPAPQMSGTPVTAGGAPPSPPLVRSDILPRPSVRGADLLCRPMAASTLPPRRSSAATYPRGATIAAAVPRPPQRHSPAAVRAGR